MRPTVLLEKIGRPIGQIGLLAVAVVAGSSWLLPLAWAAPYSLTLLLMIAALRRLVVADDVHGAGSSQVVEAGRFWRYTAPRGFAAVAQLVLQRLDIILVAGYLGAGSAAIYTAATRFVALGQLGSQAVALAVQPKLAELLALGEREKAQRVYQTSTAWVIATTWPIHLMAGILAPVALLIFGAGYGGGRGVVITLAAAMLVATGCGMVTMVLVMAGKTVWNLVNVAVALTTNITLNVILIPRVGILGAGIAWAVAIVLSNLLPLAQVRRILGIHPFGRATVMVMGLVTVTLVPLPVAGWLLAGGRPVILLLVAAISLAGYGYGLWRMRERLDLGGLLASVRRRRVGATP